METNLREAENKVVVCGVLAEKSLEKTTEADGSGHIQGYLTIKTSETNFIRFSVNVREKKKDGEKNSIYPGIVTVMEEYKSIAEVGEEADWVAIDNGNINLYTGRDGKERVGFKSNFFNRVNDKKEPNAEFEIELFIYSIVPEIVDSEDTGNYIVNGWVPTYNGIEPIKLVAEGEIGSQVEEYFSAGQTARFYGNIVNSKIETRTEIPMKIGKPKVEIKTTYKDKLVITNVSEAYEEGITPSAPYNAETIRAAVKLREEELKKKKESNQTSQPTLKTKPSAAAHGRVMGW